MRTAGDYALLHANGTSFAEIVKMIRDEQAGYFRLQGLGKDCEIIEYEGVDGTDEYMEWTVYTKVEETE